MPDDESTAKENSPPDKPSCDEDDAWVPLPSTRRLRGGRRLTTPAPAAPRPGEPHAPRPGEPRPGEPEDGG
ncbi:MAG TPA: hypothetical protein VFR67_31030 [Pilimelia sp.]|nr:hypothetical protein [Pilimelia sp.]